MQDLFAKQRNIGKLLLAEDEINIALTSNENKVVFSVNPDDKAWRPDTTEKDNFGRKDEPFLYVRISKRRQHQ